MERSRFSAEFFGFLLRGLIREKELVGSSLVFGLELNPHNHCTPFKMNLFAKMADWQIL